MDKIVVTPNNKVSDLEVKLQKENVRLKTQIINLKEKIIDLKAKNLKLSQKVTVLETKSKKANLVKPPPIIETDNEELKKLMES